MDMVTQVQTLNEAVCISQSTDTLGKCINTTILSSAMGKIVRQTECFSIGMTTSLREEKLWIQIGLVSHPAHVEGR